MNSSVILVIVLILIAVLSLIFIISLNLRSFQRIFTRSKKDKSNKLTKPVLPQPVPKTPLNIQKTIEEVQVARQRYERIGELRHLDIQIAETFMFYVSVQWGRNYRQPTGIPRTEYDSYRPADNQLREAIPYYSTNQLDYSMIEKNGVGASLHKIFLQILAEEELDETSATLEQKCIIWLKARTEERKRRRNRGD